MSKFPIDTQREALAKKITEELFDVNLLIQFLEEITTSEEFFSRYTSNSHSISLTTTSLESKLNNGNPNVQCSPACIAKSTISRSIATNIKHLMKGPSTFKGMNCAKYVHPCPTMHFFIGEKLTKELRLLTMEEAKLRLQTFGSDDIEENISQKLALEVWDADGHQLSLFLFTYQAITKPLQTPQICPEDVDFMRKHNLQSMLTKRNPKSNRLSC
ncbi:unnamed protein product [Angiostrongylus costaricensis]|uniref:RWD domain-containing protein n=1 Tax=Angiostrongylus costaricensis TaxID=334426 RepID=A0A0R3PPD2_ANGCS|nr:unnamed protein product [Angiostrongylus costaricensis]